MIKLGMFYTKKQLHHLLAGINSLALQNLSIQTQEDENTKNGNTTLTDGRTFRTIRASKSGRDFHILFYQSHGRGSIFAASPKPSSSLDSAFSPVYIFNQKWHHG
jgi:hypothetical protein